MTFCLDILSAKVPPTKLKLSIEKVPAPPTKPTFNAEAVNSHTKKPRATVCICMALIIKIKPIHNLRKFGFNSDSSILPNETLRFSLIVLQPYFESKVIRYIDFNLSTKFEVGVQIVNSTHLLQEGINRCSIWTRYRINNEHRVDFNFVYSMVAYMTNG